jgi:hypothetical protein
LVNSILSHELVVESFSVFLFGALLEYGIIYERRNFNNDYVTLPSSYAHIFFDFYLFVSAFIEKKNAMKCMQSGGKNLLFLHSILIAFVMKIARCLFCFNLIKIQVNYAKRIDSRWALCFAFLACVKYNEILSKVIGDYADGSGL